MASAVDIAHLLDRLTDPRTVNRAAWLEVLGELVHFEARSPLVIGHLVGRKDDEGVVVTTFIQYEKRMTATLVWAILAPLHRRLARYLLQHAADHVPHPA